jgi:hypothetical protein
LDLVFLVLTFASVDAVGVGVVVFLFVAAFGLAVFLFTLRGEMVAVVARVLVSSDALFLADAEFLATLFFVFLLTLTLEVGVLLIVEVVVLASSRLDDDDAPSTIPLLVRFILFFPKNLVEEIRPE